MKCIPAEKAIAEIERLKKINFNITCEANKNYCRGYADAVEDILHTIASLQKEQPEVDMEKFTEMIQTFQGRYKYPESISIKGAMAFMARMFYQYPNVARLWYEQMPEATMDNARKEETK